MRRLRLFCSTGIRIKTRKGKSPKVDPNLHRIYKNHR